MDSPQAQQIGTGGYKLRKLGTHRFGFDSNREGRSTSSKSQPHSVKDEDEMSDDPMEDRKEAELEGEEVEEEEEPEQQDQAFDDDVDRALFRIYHDPNDPGSYGGIQALLRSARRQGISKLSEARVKRFLSGQSSYTLHRQVRKRFTRNRTFVSGIDDQWQADLVDMHSLAAQNQGNKFLLTCIDVFSKYAWVLPVREKSSQAMCRVFRTLFDKEAAPRLPKRLQTDKGKEFFNASLEKLFRECEPHPVHHFASWSDQKAAVVERFNRTLKSRMWRYFSARNTKRYLQVLPQLVHAYNNSRHRTIGLTPAAASLPQNSELVRKRLYPLPPPPPPPPRAGNPPGAGCQLGAKCPPPTTPKSLEQPHESSPTRGDIVRISKWKGSFEKGYMPNWSREDFRVTDRVESNDGRVVYRIEDKQGEPIKGVFYREELQPISRNQYRIEQVLKQRRTRLAGKGMRVEYLVKWDGWPAKFNSWISREELTRYRHAVRYVLL